MKHHISVTVRVDGDIEHQFDKVLEGEEKTINLVGGASQAVLNVTSEWHHERGAGCSNRTKHPWPGASRSILRWWDSKADASASFE